MTVAFDDQDRRLVHPLHAVLLGGAAILFFIVALCDVAYFYSFEMQWKNFASWLIIGGLILGGFALLWEGIELIRAWSHRRRKISFLLLLTSWVLGFINALVHAKDAWATMPEGLVLSILVAVFAIAATSLSFRAGRVGGLK